VVLFHAWHSGEMMPDLWQAGLLSCPGIREDQAKRHNATSWGLLHYSYERDRAGEIGRMRWLMCWGGSVKRMINAATSLRKLRASFWVPLMCSVFLVTALIATAGCAPEVGAKTVSLGESFSLAVGQSASIDGEDLAIKFIDVIADSRCPSDVVCIWQGEAACLVEITHSGTGQQMVLTYPGLTQEPSEAQFGSYQFTFSVEPYPEAGKEIGKSEYRLNLVVTKTPPLSGGILVTFDVAGDQYSIFVTNNETIEEVFAVQRGESQATIPNGLIVGGAVFYNQPWSWHMDSQDIHMAEMTIELYDGLPSFVESELEYWLETVHHYAPWSATIKAIEDFR